MIKTDLWACYNATSPFLLHKIKIRDYLSKTAPQIKLLLESKIMYLIMKQNPQQLSDVLHKL